MACLPVQSTFAIRPNEVPGSITLPGVPTPGNVVIVMFGCNIDEPNLVVDTTKWKSFTGGGGWKCFNTPAGTFGARLYTRGVYRYVQPGDLAALPAICSGGSTYWAYACYEVSGVSGVWNNDLLFAFTREDIDSLIALPILPTIKAGSLALTCIASYNGTSNPTVGGSWTLDYSNNNAVNYGSIASASRQIAAAGTPLDGIWTNVNSNPYGGLVLVLQPGA